MTTPPKPGHENFSPVYDLLTDHALSPRHFSKLRGRREPAPLRCALDRVQSTPQSRRRQWRIWPGSSTVASHSRSCALRQLRGASFRHRSFSARGSAVQVGKAAAPQARLVNNICPWPDRHNRRLLGAGVVLFRLTGPPQSPCASHSCTRARGGESCRSLLSADTPQF